MVAFGILGIVNGYSMYMAKYFQDLIKNKQLPF
jgi:hypothetical protein